MEKSSKNLFKCILFGSGKEAPAKSLPQNILKANPRLDPDAGVTRTLKSVREDLEIILQSIFEAKANYSLDFDSRKPSVNLCVGNYGLTKKQVLEKLKDFFNDSEPTLFCIFYSGQGLVKSGNWKCKDGQVDFDDVISAIDKANLVKRESHVFVCMDSCFSGAWVDELQGLGGKKSKLSPLLVKYMQENVTVQASCSASENSYDGRFVEYRKTAKEKGHNTAMRKLIQEGTKQPMHSKYLAGKKSSSILSLFQAKNWWLFAKKDSSSLQSIQEELLDDAPMQSMAPMLQSFEQTGFKSSLKPNLQASLPSPQGKTVKFQLPEATPLFMPIIQEAPFDFKLVEYYYQTFSDQGSSANECVTAWMPGRLDGYYSLGCVYINASYASNPEMKRIKSYHIRPKSDYFIAKPATWKKLWDSTGEKKMPQGSIWIPVPPNDNYAAMGTVAIQISNQATSDDIAKAFPDVVCVHISLLYTSSVSSMIWNTHGSTSVNDVTLWSVKDSPYAYASEGLNSPDGIYAYSLRAKPN